MTIVYTVLITLAILAALAGIWFVFHQLSFINKRLADLEAAEAKRTQALTDARGRERAHHSYNTIDGLEDAMAVLIDHILQLDADQARAQTALAILRQVRKSPYAYGEKED